MEKIDVIRDKVFCYDENCDLIKSLNLADFQNIDFGYLEGAKFFSLNISQPIKRVVKFSEINGLDSSAEFVEYPSIVFLEASGAITPDEPVINWNTLVPPPVY
jgi:hypothetical protein